MAFEKVSAFDVWNYVIDRKILYLFISQDISTTTSCYNKYPQITVT